MGSKGNDPGSLHSKHDDVFERAVNNVKTKKRKVNKSNTSKTSELSTNSCSNEDKAFSKGVKSLIVEESNEFCLFSDSKEMPFKEDAKASSQEVNSYGVSSLSKSEIQHSNSNNSNSNNHNNRREKFFIEQETPTPQYDSSSNERPKPKKTFDQIENVIDIFNKASSIKKELQPPIIHAPKEVSFWDKFFAPFRCLDNNNNDNQNN